MLSIQLSVNIIWLLVLPMIAFLLGIFFRAVQLANARKKAIEMEKDLYASHAEILELYREKSELEKKLINSPIPVIPINASKEEKNTDKLPDVGMRKKVFGGQTSIQQNS